MVPLCLHQFWPVLSFFVLRDSLKGKLLFGKCSNTQVADIPS